MPSLVDERLMQNPQKNRPLAATWCWRAILVGIGDQITDRV
ncbi:hypothetical protein [Synechococcus sp. RS9916]|nr:hypothetical protein [Synechococcus sp. RS9916]